MCVCVCVYIYICVCVYISVYTHKHTHIHVYICVYVCVHKCVHTQTHTHTYIYIYIYVFVPQTTANELVFKTTYMKVSSFSVVTKFRITMAPNFGSKTMVSKSTLSSEICYSGQLYGKYKAV
jgi:hypothetical protein